MSLNFSANGAQSLAMGNALGEKGKKLSVTATLRDN